MNNVQKISENDSISYRAGPVTVRIGHEEIEPKNNER